MIFLIIKHIDIEGPGTLGEFLRQKGIPWDTVELGSGERLPPSPKGYDAVVVLGGPMNVYEENRYPFLAEEDRFIKECLCLKIPYLGVCLGSQLLAKAAGARVVRSPAKEIGWYHINLTDKGKDDPVLKDFLPTAPVFHWHSDMFEVPEEAFLLAAASGCPHQALRVGANAFGLQFHIEVTDKDIKEWYNRYAAADPVAAGLQPLLAGYRLNKNAFQAQAEKIYENFLKLAY